MCDNRALLKSSYGPLSSPLSVYVAPPCTPLGHRWRLIGGSDIKQLPHHGAFDKEKASYVKSPRSNWGCTWGCTGGFDTVTLPHYGYLTLGHVKYPL